jgi:hypothetical protein
MAYIGGTISVISATNDSTIGGNTSEFSWGHQELLGGSSPLRFAVTP